MVRREKQQPTFMEAFAYIPSTETTLDKINLAINWKPIRNKIESLYRKTGPGRPAFPVVTMFKAILLQVWYDLSDPAAEEAIADRLSFRRFLGLSLDEKTPDHSTLHRFRDRIAPIADRLFHLVNRQLELKGLTVKSGTLVDASLVQSAAKLPSDGGLCRDNDASWGGKKGGQVFGYKAHVGMDRDSEIIRRAEFTPANIHDSQLFRELVVGDESEVYADKAYSSLQHSEWLDSLGIVDYTMIRGSSGKRLGSLGRGFNRSASRIRQGVERFFGTMKRIYKFRRCRYWTLSRNRCYFLVLCIGYNLRKAARLGASQV